MNFLERAIAGVAPGWAARRARSRTALAHYDAASTDRRTSSLRATRTDADAAASRRAKLAFLARDMVRNTPLATRAQSIIAGAVVGDGIVPKITLRGKDIDPGLAKAIKERGLRRIEEHLDSTDIDRRGRQNLYGLQRLIINTVVDAGECLVRRHADTLVQGGMPFQLEVLEPDHLDETRWGTLPGGGEIRDGIEYDGQGRRTAYWLFPQHPGSDSMVLPVTGVSVRVPADQILHVFRQDRPGQNRGVSWFAPVVLRLQDLADHEDAQLMRQKIAACFAVFRTGGEQSPEMPSEIMPGMVYDLGDSEEITFATPPGVSAYDEFTRSALRSVAVGLGVTYESLTGDLSQVNFASARMGRLDMDQNVSSWQWLMMVPQLLHPVGAWFLDAWQGEDGDEMRRAGIPDDIWSRIGIEWAPPRRVIVDPSREFAALKEAVRAGFMSRQNVIRQFGFDPERLNEELIEDAKFAADHRLVLDSDARNAPGMSAPATAQDAQMDDGSDATAPPLSGGGAST